MFQSTETWNWVNWTTVGFCIAFAIFFIGSMAYILWQLKRPNEKAATLIQEIEEDIGIKDKAKTQEVNI